MNRIIDTDTIRNLIEQAISGPASEVAERLAAISEYVADAKPVDDLDLDGDAAEAFNPCDLTVDDLKMLPFGTAVLDVDGDEWIWMREQLLLGDGAARRAGQVVESYGPIRLANLTVDELAAMPQRSVRDQLGREWSHDSDGAWSRADVGQGVFETVTSATLAAVGVPRDQGGAT